MSLRGTWYAKLWRRLAAGRRAVLGVWCYLGAGVLCVMLAAFSDAATATRIGSVCHWCGVDVYRRESACDALSSDAIHASVRQLIHDRVATVIVEDSVGAGVEEEVRGSAGCEYGDVARVGFALRR